VGTAVPTEAETLSPKDRLASLKALLATPNKNSGVT
jgi:ATP-dependent DNA helicase Rep